MCSELLTLGCLIALDVTWLTPWLFVMGANPSAAPLLPVPIVFGLAATGCLLTWLVGRRAATIQTMRWAVLLAGVFVSIITSSMVAGERLPWPDALGIEATSLFQQGVGSSLLGLIVSLGVWWRATNIGGTRPGERGVAGRTATGLAALSVVALLSLAGVGTGPPWTLYAAILVFLLTAVLASSLEGLEYVRSSAKTPSATGFGRGWIVLSMGFAVAVLVVGLLAAAAVERQGLALVAAAFRALLTVIEVAILALALPAGLLIELLSRLIHVPAGRVAAQPPSGLGRSPLPTPGPATTPVHVPPWLVQVGGGLVVALVVTLVVVGLFISLRRIPPPRDDQEIPEEHSSVWNWRLAREAFQRWTSRRQSEHIGDQVDGVRLAYRAFLALMFSSGFGRYPSETPADFERRIEPEMDSVEPFDAVDQLTRRYELARYGPDDPSAEDTADAQAATERIERQLGTKAGTSLNRRSRSWLS